jgi:hypothetical protein
VISFEFVVVVSVSLVYVVLDFVSLRSVMLAMINFV